MIRPFRYLSAPSRSCAIVVAVVLGWSAGMPAAHAQPPAVSQADVKSGPVLLYLAVTINGNPVADLLPFTYQEGGLWATAETLQSVGFAKAQQRPGLTRLDTIEGTRVDYDANNQTVSISAPLSVLSLGATVVSTGQSDIPVISDGRGMVLNYDLYGNRDDKGGVLLSAASEVRAFNPWGVFSSSAFSQTGKNQDLLLEDFRGGGWTSHNVRLDTSWKSSWPDRALTLTLGDTNTGGLSWSRATRLGGLRIGTNFALQPYRTTAPLPAFMGSAVVPSAVDLYIDGVKRYTGRVPAGPFQLNSLPAITGRGSALVVLTDAAGRQTQIDIPFYASTTMLEQGLSDWSIETGYVRKDYGLSSFSYASDPLVMGTIRHGMTKSLTLEGHVESGRNTRVAGVGAVATVGTLGQVSGSYSGSTSEGKTGAQYSLGYQWVNRHFNIGANMQRTRRSYRDVASLYGGAPAEITESAVVGTTFQSIGSLNANYVRVRYPGEPASRYAGAYWSRSLGNRMTISASFNRNLDDSQDRNFYIGLSISLDGNISAFSTMQRSRDQTSYSLNANKSVEGETGFAWALNARRTQMETTGGVQLDYRGQSAEYRAGMTSYGTGRTAYAGVTGSLVTMGGSVFAGRRIHDGFAVVSTGVPNIPVKLHNNLVGRTDEDGLLMIAPLNAYQKNLVSIDPMELPVNVKIDRVAVDVATRERAGTLVPFVITPVRAASLILHDANGALIPLGASVALNDSGVTTFVGYDGMVYLEGLEPLNTVHVTHGAMTCSARFNYEDPGDAVSQIGPLRCE
ncbi:fimbrial biogenesis outer membrane usher protein [Parapusillimonas sp. SGNA-6]|nr:fimbrial biogenesis outer membrane usher protein [Parapusillimonas sp. SGNA-6]